MVGGAATDYLRAGTDVIADYNGAVLLRRFIHGPGTDDPVAVIDNTGYRYFYHTDATGTVVALSNDTGVVQQRYRTDAFGRVDQPGGDAVYRFAGRPFDAETGLYYNRARYYHPGLGRFLSADPTGYADGLNLYAYAGNDPVNFADPNGLAAAAAKQLGQKTVAAYKENKDAIQLSMDAGGMTPVIGNFVDIAHGVLYAFEGDFVNAGGSVIAALPVIGQAFTAGKLTVKSGQALAKAGKVCSFPGDTPVLTEAGPRPIATIRPGDRVLAVDQETGEQAWKPVLEAYGVEERRIYTLAVTGADGAARELETTDNHRYFVTGQGWRVTAHLQPGDVLATQAGTVTLDAKTDTKRFTRVHNLKVADYHTYYAFAGDSALLVHNCGGTPKLLPAPKPKGNANTAPEIGTIFVDSKSNAIPTPPGGRITGSPDGKFIQARDANGKPTGVRIDGGHKPTHTDTRALRPHGHVPGVNNLDGTPWLPIRQ